MLSSVTPAVCAAETEDFPRPGWRLTTSIIPKVYMLGPEGIAKGVAPIQEHSGAVTTRYDVRQALTSIAGIEFPPGALAVYEERGATLVVVAPDDIAGLPETLCMMCGWTEPTQVRVTATLVEFATDRANKLRNLSYARLRSVAGNSWREREELALTTKNVERGTAVKRLGEQQPQETQSPDSTDDPKPPLAPGEAGTALNAEPVVGADGVQVSLRYAWQRRLGAGDKAEQLEMSGSLIVTNGVPVVVSQWPANNPGDSVRRNQLRFLALVIRADILTADGVPVRQAFVEGMESFRQTLKAKKQIGGSELPADRAASE